MKKLVLLLTFFPCLLSYGQGYKVYKSDGKVDAYSGETVKTITLNDDSLRYEGHEYVDLGLPSGTKWACCNLGAEKPYEDGKYYAWGELESKRYFYFDNYKYYVPNQQEYYMFLGENIAASKYDAATYLLGSGWRAHPDFSVADLHRPA